MLVRTLEPPVPFDLRATLGVLGLRGFDRDGRAWIARSMPSGPATVAIGRTGTVLEAAAWGEGGDDLLDRLPRMLGFDEDVDAFQPSAGPVRELHRRARGLRLGSTGSVSDVLVSAVLGQKVTTTEAGRNLRRLVHRYGQSAPGPWSDLRLIPTPDVIASRALGIERRRATTLIECARRARRLEAALDLDPTAARRRLLAIRGVGEWTTEGVMGTAYGDRDAALVGDYHMPSLVTWALAGEARGDDTRMLELLEPYRPYRRRVQVLLKRSGLRAPRFGPKAPLRSIERI